MASVQGNINCGQGSAIRRAMTQPIPDIPLKEQIEAVRSVTRHFENLILCTPEHSPLGQYYRQNRIGLRAAERTLTELLAKEAENA